MTVNESRHFTPILRVEVCQILGLIYRISVCGLYFGRQVYERKKKKEREEGKEEEGKKRRRKVGVTKKSEVIEGIRKTTK